MSRDIDRPQDGVPLAQQIESVEQIAAMDLDDLKLIYAKHEAECIELAGRIEASDNAAWIRRARQALRILHLHKHWLTRELAHRKRTESKADQKQNVSLSAQARIAAQKAITERQQLADAARLARIQASNDQNLKDIAEFKKVAHEVLGQEMYEHLWELTKLRLARSA